MPFGYNMLLNDMWGISEEALRSLVTGVSAYNKSPCKDIEDFKNQLQGTMQGQSSYLSGSRLTRLYGSIAVIPIHGVIFPRATWDMWMVNGVSCADLMHDFNVALHSEEVSHVVFDVDSPGGYLPGVSDLAKAIVNARGSDKRIVTYVSGCDASAAYWISAGVDEIVTTDIGIAGAIGVIVVLIDPAEMNKKEGIRTYEFVSSISPRKS